MKTLLFSLSILTSSFIFNSCSVFESDEGPQEGTCSNWTQDSTVIAGIMELNGQEKGYTGNISNCTEGRLTHWFPLSDFTPIDTIPPSIGQLSELKKLELQQNKLRSLPLDIGSLKKLTHLNLRDNQLQTLPTSIGDLENLSTLFLGINNLKTLPSEIGNLKKLNNLNFSSNNLQTIPDKLANLKQKFSSGRIKFNDNQICSFSPKIQAWIDFQNIDISQQKCDESTP